MDFKLITFEQIYNNRSRLPINYFLFLIGDWDLAFSVIKLSFIFT